MYVFIDFSISLLNMLSDTGLALISFLNSYPELLGVRLLDYSYAEILFGVGLPIFMGYAAVKFVVDIVT